MKIAGVLGNFTDPNAIMSAAEKTNKAGFTNFDCFTPYPLHGLDRVMGVKRTILPYISFVGAICGTATALGLQSWTGAMDYKLNIGGKQLFAFQFSIPIDFELTVLLCAISTVVGLLVLCKIPTWWHAFQDDKGFQKATDDEFVLGIYADDARFNEESVVSFMKSLGANDVRVIHEGEAQR